MRKKKGQRTLLAWVAAVSLMGQAQAAIVTPISSTSDNPFILAGDLGETHNGISIGVASDGLVVSDANFTPGSTVTYTLGAATGVDSFLLWNDVGSGSGQGIDGFQLGFFNGTSSLGTFAGNATAGTGIPNLNPAQIFTVGNFTDVTSAVLQIDSVHSSAFNNNLQYREVAFGSVPEPSVSLLGMACGVVTMLRRKRK